MEPHLFVVFGATGDLTSRKLLPALYALIERRGFDECVVLGVGGTPLDDAAFRERAAKALADAGSATEEAQRWCTECLHYQQVGRDEDHAALVERIAEVEARHDLPGNRTYYLALPPSAFPGTITNLGEAGLHEAPGWVRLVVEKPFGRSLETARELNEVVHRWFPESAVYRIDHYLGKETVQNLLAFRFANTIFESLWNRDRVSRVELTVAEAVGVGRRAGYYDAVGAVRDMVQNHLTQTLTLVAMEPPASFDPTAIRNEKVKVLKSIAPPGPDDVVLGQYGAGVVGGRPIPAYRDEEGAATDSDVATYAALRLKVDTWRWQGVPFYLRTGKALSRQVTQIAVTFQRPPIRFFQALSTAPLYADVLVITLQPEEGFELRIGVKKPGQRLALETIPLAFEYAARFGPIPDAYETLLADIITGDQTLFVRSDEVEESWRLYDPILADPPAVHHYPAGTWGPEEARALLGDGRDWTTQ